MQIGDPAPAFKATDDTGKPVSLEDFRGRWLVLFFFPSAQAFSMGCALEAGRFEAMLPEFEAVNASVIGVSTDATQTQADFRSRCKLSYPLLSDRDKTISHAYNVLGGLMGLLGQADRQSFLIDPEGRIAFHWRRVMNLAGHALEVKQEIERQAAPKLASSRS